MKNSEIRVHTKAGLGKVRETVDKQGRSWACIKDMCDILGYTNAKVITNYRIKMGHMSQRDIYRLKWPNHIQFTNERGVLALTAKMKQKERKNALALRKWVLNEILHNADQDKGPKQEYLDFEKGTALTPTKQGDIQMFEHPMFGTVRTMMNEQGVIQFCARDVCKILRYSNPRDAINRHVEEEDVVKRDTPTKGGMQLMTYVSESGLYALIFGSKMKAAKLFTHWVTSDVIPSIRKYGIYMTPSTIEKVIHEPEWIGEYAIILKNEQEKRMAAEREKEELARRVDVQAMLLLQKDNVINQFREMSIAQTKLLDAQAEDARLGKFLNISQKDMHVGEFAAILAKNGVDIGRNRLFADWRRDGWCCCTEADWNRPTQEALDMGVLTFKMEPVENLDGELRPVTYVTPKGQKYFLDLYLRQQTPTN